MDPISIRLNIEGAYQVQAGASKAAAGLTQLGQASAKAGQQTQLSGYQMSQVSAQLQDLFVQIQGGSAPLTALLQQGSQLSAVFGGVGGALKAVGSLITPTVATLGAAGAAVGALAVAYSKGAAEAQAYTRALVLSGNAAGVTVGQLQAMAAAQAKVVGTQGDAAQALAALAATGQVVDTSLNMAGEAATRLARVGVPLADTVKKFAELGKDPLKAIISLNEAENFLTESVYRQIKALTEQGRLAEAAALAQQTYATISNERTGKLVQSLGTLERAWIGVKDKAAEAWDKMLNIGRTTTLEDQLKGVQAQIEAAQAKIAAAQSGDLKASKPWLDTDRIAAAQQRLVTSLQGTAAALAKKLDIERLNATAEADAAKSIKARIQADEDGAKAAKALTAERERDAAALEKAVGLSGSYQKDLSELHKLRQRGLLTEQQYVKAVEDLIKAQPVVREQMQAQDAAHKEAAKALDDLLKAEQKRIEAQYKVAASVEEQIQKLRDEEAGLALAAERNISLAAAIELVRVARLEEAHAKATASQDYAYAAALRAEIDAREKLAGLIDAKAGREAAKKSAEDAAREWKRSADEIERTITDALMRGFESGKSLAVTLRDTLVNTFKTMVLRPTIQALVQPVAGTLLGGSAASAAASTGSALGGIGTLGGIAGLFGAGGLSGALAGGAGWLTGATTLSGSLTAAGSLIGTGSLAGVSSGLAMGAGALGPIALGLAGVYSLINSMDNSGTPHVGADYISTATGGYRPGANEVGLYSAGASVNEYRSQAVEDVLKTLTGTGAGLLNSLATAFGKEASYAVGGYFAADNNDPAQANTRITSGGSTISSTATRYGVSDAKEGMQAFTAELAGQVRGALTGMDIPGWAKAQLEALAGSAGFEELANAVQSISVTREALQQLGAAMPQLANITDATVTDLLKAMGGIEGLKASASAYYDAFYTDTEKNARATQQLGEAMAGLGLQVPTTREAFRALVEAQDLSTESGRAAYAQLLQLSPAFAALVPATQTLADTTAAAAQQMLEAAAKVMADLGAQQGALQVELLKAQGDVAGAAALERQQALAKLVQGLSGQDAAAAVAAYDFNAALRQQIDALNAATTAAQQAAQAEAQRVAAIAAQRDNIQAQIDQQLGDTTALRARELAGLDESNRALQLRLYALQDETAATQAATQAAQDLAAKQAAVASQHDNIQAQIDQLTGDTAAIRARELAGLDESNRALQQHYYDLLDAKTAQEAAAQAAQQAAQAAEQLRSAWQNVGNSLIDEVARIRGLTLGTGAQSLSAARMQFAVSTAQARAGDQDAAKLLPTLSRSLLELVGNTATSRADLDRAQAQVAASLEGTASVLGGMFGFSVQRATAVSPVDVQAILQQVAATAPIVNAAVVQQQAASATQDATAVLVEEVRALRAQVAALQDLAQRGTAAGERTRDVLVSVTEGGRAMQTEAAQ